jgi:hypothetical protein
MSAPRLTNSWMSWLPTVPVAPITKIMLVLGAAPRSSISPPDGFAENDEPQLTRTTPRRPQQAHCGDTADLDAHSRTLSGWRFVHEVFLSRWMETASSA